VTLREIIEQEIRERGPIPFSRYMELCLYHSELGYYSRNAEQFGKAGDFFTSSDVHAVFGRLLARQFEEMWRAMNKPQQTEIVELGPGRGLFAQDVLDWSEKKFPEFFAALRYSLVERSPALRARIGQTLERHLKSNKARLTEFEESGKGTTLVVPPRPNMLRALVPEVPAIVFANEFFDAFPVELVSTHGSVRISSENGRFIETWVPPSPEELEFLDRYSVHPEPGERLEVPLAAHAAMSDIAHNIESGFLVVIDYGYTRNEQLAGRHRGTVKAIRQHSVSATPYEAPGEQDITADVNFTSLAAAVQQVGMDVYPLRTQSQFLMGIGETNQFADAFEACRLPQERAKVALQLKHLVTPAGMGESFHVMVASRGISKETAANLSGLSFGRGNR
jgi:SAM-dependent MidA family methyltransferase